MVSLDMARDFGTLIDFEFPASDLVAVLPYVLPLIFIGTAFILFQRFLPRNDFKRNVLWISSIGCFISACVLVLYSGFGSSFGSWWGFVTLLQWFTDIVFASAVTGTLYIAFIAIVFAFVAKSVIATPDPDFTTLRDELKQAKGESTSTTEKVQKLEAENKKLHEYLSEREESLATLQGELEGLKLVASETPLPETKIDVPASSADIDEDMERDLLFTVSQKDQTISRLQSEIADLRLIMESGEMAPASETGIPGDAQEKIARLETKLKTNESTLDDFERRSFTAAEVSDSVISDLAELISQIESSAIDETTRKAMTNLVENLGRSMGRVCGPSDKDVPRIELIGAVMMVHEIVDTIKKILRNS
ncbi:MAG: hypothetical protein ACTSU3_05230 [Candidatus Thorarchaeota archaeon]